MIRSVVMRVHIRRIRPVSRTSSPSSPAAEPAYSCPWPHLQLGSAETGHLILVLADTILKSLTESYQQESDGLGVVCLLLKQQKLDLESQ